jgi:hypothetical protein
MVVVGLLHGLGRVLYELPSTVLYELPSTATATATSATATATTAATAAAVVTSDERDCSLSEYAWIVGTPFPSCICCPSYNADSTDATNTTCCTGLGKYTEGCGLDTCLLTWTGTYVLQFIIYQLLYVMLRCLC